MRGPALAAGATPNTRTPPDGAGHAHRQHPRRVLRRGPATEVLAPRRVHATRPPPLRAANAQHLVARRAGTRHHQQRHPHSPGYRQRQRGHVRRADRPTAGQWPADGLTAHPVASPRLAFTGLPTSRRLTCSALKVSSRARLDENQDLRPDAGRRLLWPSAGSFRARGVDPEDSQVTPAGFRLSRRASRINERLAELPAADHRVLLSELGRTLGINGHVAAWSLHARFPSTSGERGRALAEDRARRHFASGERHRRPCCSRAVQQSRPPHQDDCRRHDVRRPEGSACRANGRQLIAQRPVSFQPSGAEPWDAGERQYGAQQPR